MSINVSATHAGAQTAARTYQMLTDPDFYAMVTALMPDAEQVSTQIDRAAGTVVCVQRVDLPASVPSMVRRVVGASMLVRETQRWDVSANTPARAEVTIEPADLPAPRSGAYAILSGDGAAQAQSPCLVEVTGTVTVNVPMLGRQLESLIAENFLAVVSLRGHAAVRWDQQRSR